jgi:type II secretory pathway pseudopilin PulG
MKHPYGQTRVHRSAASPAGEKAFTRVELVVVIAVVGLLSLVLRTTMASSHEGSDRSVCVNNLKQLVTAAMMCALDNQDQMPYPNWGNTEPGWLYAPIGGNPPNLGANPYLTNALLAYQGGALWSFVKDTWAYRCPLDKTKASYNPYYPGRANKLSTYVMNGAVCGYGSQTGKKPNTYKLAQFNPNAFMMWEPDDKLVNPSTGSPLGSFAYNDASSYPDMGEGVGLRHVTGAPLATFSGQVEWTSFALFQQEQIAGRLPTRLWCNPGSDHGR